MRSSEKEERNRDYDKRCCGKDEKLTVRVEREREKERVCEKEQNVKESELRCLW